MMTNMHRGTRGQTLPIWMGTAILTIVFAFFLGSYGNVIAYQFRAQAAADSAASAVVAIQAQEFNQMTEGLYAAGIEEYRLRHLLETIRITSARGGGCDTLPGRPSCAAVWSNAIRDYRIALGRYSADAQMVSRITNNMTYDRLTNDGKALISDLQSACNQAASSPFKQTVQCFDSNNQMHFTLDAIAQRKALGAVYSNAQTELLPSYATTGTSQAWSNTFAPIAAQVTVCATVPSIFPAYLGALAQPAVVVARAAATNAMIEQDWIQPGNSTSSISGQVFQPSEGFTGTNATDQDGYHWYDVDFGGNASKATTYAGSPPRSSLTYLIQKEEFSARTGWWSPVQIMPFDNAPAPESSCS